MLASARSEAWSVVTTLSDTLPSVLIVDDDEVAASELAETLELDGFNCIATSTLEQAISLTTSFPSIKVIITDFYLHGATTATANGLALLERVRGTFPNRMFNFIVVSGDHDVFVDCALTEAVKFLAKPIAPESISAMVRGEVMQGEDAPSNVVSAPSESCPHHMIQVQASTIASLTEALNDMRAENRAATSRLDRLVSAASIAQNRHDEVGTGEIGELLRYILGQGYSVKTLLGNVSGPARRADLVTISDISN